MSFLVKFATVVLVRNGSVKFGPKEDSHNFNARGALETSRSPQAADRALAVSNFVDIIFEDDDYFFVNKPPGISVAGEAGEPNGFHERVKLHARQTYGHWPNLLHRLDKPTSGIMCYAKTEAAAKHYLRLQQTRGAITKDYLAVVQGGPQRDSGRIHGGICKSRDCTTFVVRGRRSGKEVLTTYRVLARGPSSAPKLGDLCGISLRLFTGRKHQIRASLRKLGCPIVGDEQYGGAPFHRLLLHAHRLAFTGEDGVLYDVRCLSKWGEGLDDLVVPTQRKQRTHDVAQPEDQAGHEGRPGMLRQADADAITRVENKTKGDLAPMSGAQPAAKQRGAVEPKHEMELGASDPASTWRIVLEEWSLLVVDKGHGLLTVPGKGPAKADCLLSRLRDAGWDGISHAPHRLDRDTSGLVALGRTAEAHRSLATQFQARTIGKRYEALVLGWPATDEGEVDVPIGKLREANVKFGRMVAVPADSGGIVNGHAVEGARSCLTQWRVVERGVRKSGHDHPVQYARVALIPVTGRAHQLRVHMQHIGHPILGDQLHGTEIAIAASSRLCLHAAALSFNHPEDACLEVKAESPVPF
ncbi:hypothetical protein CYMTET_9426 [Cymbomonas tetramitiformis]|uniref:Pseudouridine synthase RsuA/RluA-like domain-containing protein n=1 Tax=Cymbomonas tetramitiformis TaxID=36881 RepID=A0AAE0GRI3_9CHLO|nr:hypothetical protein CYMTET_9426 [Cymbomonas tetramitiformis]